MKQSIEIFSGSAHVSAALLLRGFKTFTVDFNPKFKPELCGNIRELPISAYPAECSFFWASPDCSKLSRAAPQRHWLKQTLSYRNYRYVPVTIEAMESLLNVARTVELIKHFNPGVWYIENPVGRIHHTAPMRSIGHYRYAVNYADWGFPYSKETYIFTNQLLPLPTVVPLRHSAGLRSVSTSYLRSLIPPKLIDFLIDHSVF